MALDVERIKKLVKDYGVKSDSENGQNFLVDDAVLGREVDAAGLGREDTVLEIGPGFGALTEELIKRCAVVAIEKDVGIYSYLINKYELSPELTLINGDVLEMVLPKFNKVVSNPPYNIVDRILEKLLHYEFDTGVMVLPKTISDQLVGDAEQTRLSFVQRLFFSFENVMDVPKEAFYPQPRVTSRMLKFVTRKGGMMKEIMLHDEMTLKNAIMRADYAVNGSTKNASRHMIESVKTELGDSLGMEVKGLGLKELEKLSVLLG